jgi:hypothetical protein
MDDDPLTDLGLRAGLGEALALIMRGGSVVQRRSICPPRAAPGVAGAPVVSA